MSIYTNLKKPTKTATTPVKKQKSTLSKELIYSQHCVGGCYLQIDAGPADEYIVQFINKDTGTVLYTDIIKNGQWTKCFYQYHINWQIIVADKERIIKTIEPSYEGKRVFISLESSSLGDTIAWVPYAEEFRKEHKCDVILSTFHNELFDDSYPEIEFVGRGATVHNIMAQYNIGWFYKEEGGFDYHRNPIDPKTIPMQQTATDILGLDYKEIKPKLRLPKVKKTNKIGLAIMATAQVKLWNNPTGWQEVVDHINDIGYEPIILSNEKAPFHGNTYPTGARQLPATHLQGVIKRICECKAVIGVGTGLVWLAWACNVPVILISGFSAEWTEMKPGKDVKRISAPKDLRLSTECFNKYDFGKFWDWYEPKAYVGTQRVYECSKHIKAKTVIDALNELLNNKNNK